MRNVWIKRGDFGAEYELGLVYSADSRLMRATWRKAYWEESGGKDTSTCISQDILWNGSNFEIVSQRTFEIDGYSRCSIEY